MVRSNNGYLAEYLATWVGEPTLPLEVSRARYDVPFPRAWEVIADGTPIAEFTEWHEAQEWAYGMSLWAEGGGAEVRRYKYGYWPSGGWGKIGYFDINHVYHEIKEDEDD